MTELSNIQNTNIYTQDSSKSGTVSSNAPAPTVEIVDKNTVMAEGNVDVAKTGNTSSSTTSKNKRTPEELYKTIEALCTQYGLKFNEVKKFGLLERIAGCPQQALLNIDNSELQKILECLKAALEKLSKIDQKIDLEKLAELAQDYNIAIHTGWTIEGFEAAQKNKKHESLKQRLERVYPGKSPEEALELYFTAYFDEQIANKIKGETDPKKIEQIKAQEMKRQLQDFGRLLANSSDEERMLFRDAIKSLYANNRLKGLEALFKSLDSQEARSEVADSCNPDYIEAIQNKEDRFGDKPSQDEILGSTELITRNQTEAGRKEFHEQFENKAKKFFEENKEAIKRINEKLAKCEELTEEEKALKEKLDNYFTAVASGEIIGTANNVVIDDDVKENILALLNKDAFDKLNYRDVLKEAIEYIEKNPKLLTQPKDTTIKLLDKTTNSNYSAIKENPNAELANAEYNPSITTPQQENTISQQHSLGYNNSGTVDTNYPEALKKQICEQVYTPELSSNTFVMQKTPETFVEALKTGIQGVKQYINHSNVSNREVTLEILNNNNGVGAIVKKWALDAFERMNDQTQKRTINLINNCENAIAAAHRMSAESLQEIKFNSFYVKEAAEEIIEQKQEEQLQ